MRSQAVSFEKSRGIPCLNKKSVLICDNLWTKRGLWINNSQ